jgi:ABC-2 type transport system permease protein
MAAHLMMPVLTAVVIFRYLQSASSTTMMHSLPFSRCKLYNSNLISGLILVLTPVLLNGLILLAIAKPAFNNQGMDLSSLTVAADTFTRGAIIQWMWQSILIILVVYAISVFAGLVTANSIMHFATALGFNFLIPALYAIFVFYFGSYLYGFNISGDWSSTCFSISPFLETFNLYNDGGNFPPLHQLYYVVNALVLFVLSAFLYSKRKLEKASDSLAFDFMIPIICYLVAFLGMTLLGLWFKSLNQDSEFYTYAGYAAGALIFFIIGRMIVMKTPRVFNLKGLKSFAIYSLIAVVFFAGLAYDITGFEKRVPAMDKISTASLENTFLQNLYGKYNSGIYRNMSTKDLYKMHAELKSSSNIEALIALHKSILENRSDFEANSDNMIQYNIGLDYSIGSLYNLERIYPVDYYFLKNSKEMKTIFESEEFKTIHSLQNLNYQKIQSVSFSNPKNYDTPVIIKNPNDMVILLKLMDEDYADETYSEAMSLDWPYTVATINYRMEDSASKKMISNVTDLVIRESYTRTIGWLTENGYVDQIALTDDMISYISIYPPELNNQEANYKYMYGPDQYKTNSVKGYQPEEFKITDKNQIVEAMEMGKSQNISYSNYYYGTIYYDFPGKTEINGYEVTQAIFFNSDEVPDFVTNHFK